MPSINPDKVETVNAFHENSKLVDKATREYLSFLPIMIRRYQAKTAEQVLEMQHTVAEILEADNNQTTNQRLVEGYASVMFFVREVSWKFIFIHIESKALEMSGPMPGLVIIWLQLFNCQL